MTLFSPSEEQVDQAKQVEQASEKAVEATQATLCYPSDLLADGNPYNGLYTVFFISEHNESTIVETSSSEYKTDTKYVNKQGGSLANTMGKL